MSQRGRKQRLDDAKVHAAWLQMGGEYGSMRALAERFGCSPSAVSISVKRQIARLADNDEHRAHLVGKKPALTPKQRQFVRETDAKRAVIEARHAEELAQIPTHKQLAEAFGVHVNTIQKAAVGVQYKHDRVSPNTTQELAP